MECELASFTKENMIILLTMYVSEEQGTAIQ